MKYNNTPARMTKFPNTEGNNFFGFCKLVQILWKAM